MFLAPKATENKLTYFRDSKCIEIHGNNENVCSKENLIYPELTGRLKEKLLLSLQVYFDNSHEILLNASCKWSVCKFTVFIQNSYNSQYNDSLFFDLFHVEVKQVLP